MLHAAPQLPPFSFITKTL